MATWRESNGESVFSSTIDGQCMFHKITTVPDPPQDLLHHRRRPRWFARFDVGAYLELVAKKAGRTDLEYIGHVEADIAIKAGNKPTMIKIQHPGGGSAYARSYTGQKQVEAFEGGEKPSILVQGHYHVSNYMNDRNIHVTPGPRTKPFSPARSGCGWKSAAQSWNSKSTRTMER